MNFAGVSFLILAETNQAWSFIKLDATFCKAYFLPDSSSISNIRQICKEEMALWIDPDIWWVLTLLEFQ
jgi:hypothetical protein